ISRLLTSQYPNLETISGGWLLYKALGGSGQRKLSVIPPETGGYNGHFLKTMQMSFRRCLRRLRVCGSCMPLQVLAAHVKSCVEQPSSGDDFDRGSSPEVTIVAESIPPESPPGTSSTMRPHYKNSAIVLHANLRLFPMLLQIKDGLSLYGLCSIMAKYPDIVQPLFVPGVEMTADADFIISVCQAEFSERGSNKEQVEVTLMKHLQDFLQELEQAGPTATTAEGHASLGAEWVMVPDLSEGVKVAAETG
ncbi:Phosphoglucosamine mutase, partial [Dissostichus eleginoides]